MSVPAYRRKTSELKVLNHSEKVFREAIRLSKDGSTIPKRYHFVVGKNMLSNARNLMYMITNANNTDLFEHGNIRGQFQLKALFFLNCLEADIKFNIEFVKNVPSKYQNLVMLVQETRELLRKWKKSDDERTRDFRRIQTAEVCE